jgi:hypothetical protein
MKIFLESIWDLVCTIVLWFSLVFEFFVGLFLMGITLGFIANVFMAGYRFL